MMSRINFVEMFMSNEKVKRRKVGGKRWKRGPVG